MENPLSSPSPGSSADPALQGIDALLAKLPDPVSSLSPVLEIFVPVGKDDTVTMLGLWFDAVGLFHVYVQQALIPDNIFAQVKIITLRLPIAIGFTVFNLGLAMFFTRSFILGFRSVAIETANQVQAVIDKIKLQNMVQ